MTDKKEGKRIPDHLPRKLSISCWIWSWITSATEGEPYGDLERCIVELKERGFNTVRVETGLNWAFTLDGQPRGQMEFGAWIAGYGWNFSTVNSKGGGRHDVLKRLIHLFELAKKHGIWVILTSWEYQDSSWFVADPAIRSEILSHPINDRFMLLARQHDRLLNILEDLDLSSQVAFVEVHNEPEYSILPGGEGEGQSISKAEGKRLHTEAISMLRQKHPDILVSGDFSSHGDYSILPENVQVFDYHLYAGADWYFQELWGKTIFSRNFDPRNPRAQEPLNSLLKQDIAPWDEFMKPAQNIRPFWRPMMWLYENLDNAKWDEWLAVSFPEWKDKFCGTAKTMMDMDAEEGHRRGLPLVLDEGGYFYPPRLSRFEISPEGLSLLEYMADLAIGHDYWGFMPGTYSGPEHLIWTEKPEWLFQINDNFQKGGQRLEDLALR